MVSDRFPNCGYIAKEGVVEMLKHKYCVGNVIPFVGAGLSMVFQMPSWSELLLQCQKVLNCDKKMGKNLADQFEKYVSSFQYQEAADLLEEVFGKSELKQTVAGLLNKRSTDGKLLSELWGTTDNNYIDLADGELFKWFFTTNYERSLEHFIKGKVESYSLRHDKLDMQEIFQANDRRCIFHLHGDCTKPKSIVLTSKDYKSLYKDKIYTSKFGLFDGTKSFLFLGFSLKDKDITNLLNKHAMMFGGEHFIVTRDKKFAEALEEARDKILKESKRKSGKEPINFNIHPILLRDDRNYVEELRKFLRILYQTPLIECLQKWVETQNAKYDGREEKRNISPYLISEVSFQGGEKVKPMPLREYIKHYCIYAQKKKNFQLIAEGGMGKTVQLLKAAQELLEVGTAVFYVPLYMLNNMTLEEFIAKKILKTPKLYQEFQKCKEPDYSVNMQTIFMLDGFNELSLDVQSNIAMETLDLMNCDGIQILVAGREEISMLPLEILKLESLHKENVRCYLMDAAPDEKSDLWKLLEIPMMAQLYKSTEMYRNTKSQLPSKLAPFAWRTPVVSRADILWNYLQSQYFNARNMTECFEYIVALEYAVCAVAWKMVNTHSFVISRDHFNEWLRHAAEEFKNKIRSLKRISLIWDGLSNSWNCEKNFNHIQDILLNKLNFLITSENYQEVYFCHQYLRDFLAAVYMKNEAQNTISSSPAWNEFMANKNVLSLLGEFCATDELLEIWQRQRQANRETGFGDTPGFYAGNWLETVKQKGSPLGSSDFSWQDLRNVRFTEDIKADPPFCFDHSLISRNTFLSDEHIGYIRCVKWSPDGNRIATGSEDGTAKIWDSRNGICLATMVQKSAVRSIAWTPDGNCLVTGTENGDIVIWNVKEGTFRNPINFGVVVMGIEMLYKGDTWLLLISVGQGFLLYDVTNQKYLFINTGEPDAIAITQDFRFVIMSFYSTIAVWKVDSLLEGSDLEPLGTYKTPFKEIKALVLLEAQNKLLAGEYEGAIFEFRLSDLLAGNPSAEMTQIQKLESSGSIYKIDRNNRTNQLAVSAFHGVMIWDEWFQNRLYEKEVQCDGLASWSPDGMRLLVQKTFGYGIDIIDFSMYRESIQPEQLIATNQWINGLYSLSPKGSYFSCVSGTMIFIWDLRRNVLAKRLKHNEQIIGRVMWSDDETKIYFLGKCKRRNHQDFWLMDSTSYNYIASCFELAASNKVTCAEFTLEESHYYHSFDDHAQFSLEHWSPDFKKVMLEHDGRIYLMGLPDRSMVPLACAEAFERRHNSSTMDSKIQAEIKWSKNSHYVIGVCDHQFYIIWNAKTGKIIKQFNINKHYVEALTGNSGSQSFGTVFHFDKKRKRRKKLKGKYILDFFSRENEYIFCQLNLNLKPIPNHTLNGRFSNYVFIYETEDGKRERHLSLDGENIVVNEMEDMPIYLHQGDQDKLLFHMTVHEILRFGVKLLNNDSVIKETETDIMVWNIRSEQAVKTFYKNEGNVREYMLAPYSDNLIGILYAKPDEFESFWHGNFDCRKPMETVPFIKTFPLIGSTFRGAQFQDKELERAVYCSGGELGEAVQEPQQKYEHRTRTPDPILSV